MEIYIDVLILENLIINYFLIYITCKTLNVKYRVGVNLLAAFIGSLVPILMLFLSLNIYFQFILKILIAMLMIFISVGKNFKTIIKGVFVLTFYTIALGGLCIFIKFNESGIMPRNSYIVNFTYKKLILGVVISAMCMDRLFIFIKDKILVNKLIYDIEINLGGDCKIIKAFLDTGNELREPVTNLPVIIVEQDMFSNFNIPKGHEFLIPYKVVNGGRGNLKGVKADSLRLLNKNESSECKNGIIAFCNTSLSETGEYNALLSRGVL